MQGTAKSLSRNMVTDALFSGCDLPRLVLRGFPVTCRDRLKQPG
jgi:hypothetical protein